MPKTVPTESELVFEEFCQWHRLEAVRLPLSKGKSPDYRVTGRGWSVIIEVKELRESEDDRARLERVRAGHKVCGFDSTDTRVAEKLRKAGKQLRPHSLVGVPTIVCLYDTRRLGILGPDNVKIAMFGQETVVIDRTNAEYDVVSAVHPGGKRQCTPGENTSISAVALLGRRNDSFSLSIYHNHHARVPLPLVFLEKESDGQYALSPHGLPYEWQHLSQVPMIVLETGDSVKVIDAK